MPPMTNVASRPSLRVLWRSRLGAEEVAEAALPPGVVVDVATDATPERMDGVQVLVDGDPPEELLDASALERVIVPYAGVREGLRARIEARPHLTLHNSHFNAPFVAQHALSLLMACAARLGRYDRDLRQGDWGAPDGPASTHLAGRQALLLGYGAIGRAMVPMLQGLGMELEALRRRPRPDDRGVRQTGPDELHAALGRADAVLVSLPSTAATDGLLDADAFTALRPGAILVNVGRGSVIDEEATWQALDAGRLGGLGLDVWWRYPDDRAARRATLPSRRPFHLHPDVVLSPHRANAVDGWRQASVRDVLTTLAGIAGGTDPSRNVVDVGAGY